MNATDGDDAAGDKGTEDASGTWEKITKLAATPGMCDLGQGWPDFGANATARRAAAEALTSDDARANQYSAVIGSPRLIEALLKYYRATGFDLDEAYGKGEESVVVTASATEGLYGAFQAALRERPGERDEVVFIEPGFPWYHAFVKDLGGKSVAVRAHPPEFAIDIEGVRKAVSSRTCAIVHCSPHNPSGHIATMEELKALAAIAEERGIPIISDEVYERCVFDGSDPHVRMATVSEYARRNTVTVGSASKLLNLTGWRVGWVVGPPEWTSKIKGFHSLASYCAPTPLQLGVAAALDEIVAESVSGRVEPDENAAVMQRNAAVLGRALETIGIDVFYPSGGYFLVCSVQRTGLSDAEWVVRLAELALVASVPMSVFFLPDGPSPPRHLVRFAVCKIPDTIDEAARRIVAHGGQIGPSNV
jgi:N-succinyldiaminopimelate aminotransferase